MDSDFSSYKAALEWLYGQLPMFSRTGAAAYKPGLERVHALDNLFGHPHRDYLTIHVAGTNGKGSVSHTLAAILQAAGYRTGLYTSPHLVDFRERMRVDGHMIPREDVVDFLNEYRRQHYEGKPSFFELTMMMAMDWFRKQQIDIAVIETGMGGRLDSTNIISPIACVITNISKDHTQFLGNTLAAIASEKAGIMKTGIPCVVGEAEGEVKQVFDLKSKEVNAPVRYASEEELLADVDTLDDFADAHGHRYSFELKGDYQKANLRTIFTAVDMLRSRGLKINCEAMREGLAHVCALNGLMGRWQVIAREPLTVADTGHNEAGLRYNMAQLAAERAARGGVARLVIGFVSDKDVEHILDLLPADGLYYVTRAQIPRAMPVEELKRLCKAKGLNCRAYATVPQAYEAACSEADPNDVLYIGGSTFVVADLLEYLRGDE